MNLPILEVLPNVNQKHVHLGARPPQDVGEDHQAQRLDGIQHVLLHPGPDVLVLSVLGPRVDGPLVDDLDDVGVPGVDHALLVARDHGQRAARHSGCLDEPLVPLYERRVLRQRAVVAFYRGHDLADLDVASGGEVAVFWWLMAVVVSLRRGDG